MGLSVPDIGIYSRKVNCIKQIRQSESHKNSYYLFEEYNLMMELTMQDAQEKTPEVLLTEINAEESATVNGGYCGGYGYRRASYGYGYRRPNCYSHGYRYSRPVSYNYGYPCY